MSGIQTKFPTNDSINIAPPMNNAADSAIFILAAMESKFRFENENKEL